MAIWVPRQAAAGKPFTDELLSQENCLHCVQQLNGGIQLRDVARCTRRIRIKIGEHENAFLAPISDLHETDNDGLTAPSMTLSIAAALLSIAKGFGLPHSNALGEFEGGREGNRNHAEAVLKSIQSARVQRR